MRLLPFPRASRLVAFALTGLAAWTAASLQVSGAAGAPAPGSDAAPLVEELLVVRVPFVEEPGEVQATLRSRLDGTDVLLAEFEVGLPGSVQLGVETAFQSGPGDRWRGVEIETLVGLVNSGERVLSLAAGIGLEAEPGSTAAGEREFEGEVALLHHERRGRRGMFLELGLATADPDVALQYGAAFVQSFGRLSLTFEAHGTRAGGAGSARLIPGVVLAPCDWLELSAGLAFGLQDDADDRAVALAATFEF